MRRSDDEVASVLGLALGGSVTNLRQLSGGASRITSSFDLDVGDGTARPLILQQDRDDQAAQGSRAPLEAALLRAAGTAGVRVPGVVMVGGPSGLDPGWLVVERLEGETIPRKVLRDPEWSDARAALTADCGQALAAIHSIDPEALDGLPPSDPLGDPIPYLDGLGEVRPALELGLRWLQVHRGPPQRRVTVHGDFRTGNLLVGPAGLRAVLDWELAHAGDPAEDIGWLCARTWRFGGPGRVGGFGDLSELLESYAASGGDRIDPDRVTWWEVYAAVKWGVICALQASAHLRGARRSVELAAIGRRICESEWDLFVVLGLALAVGDPARAGEGAPSSPVVAPFGRPTAAELVEAVREYIEGNPMEWGDGGARFQARIARNALQAVERELELGPVIAEAHVERLARLGFTDDGALVSAIRSGRFDDDWHDVGVALAMSARDQLSVANPSYLEEAAG